MSIDIFKWLRIPSGAKVDVKAFKTWTVRWHSRHGEYGHDTRPQAEIFTTLEDAQKFAKELREAFSLIRHTSGNRVEVQANQ